MNLFLCLLAAGLYLELMRHSPALIDVQKNEDISKCDLSPCLRCIDRVKRNAANPSDVIRLLKQPAGQTRNAVRAADYMDHAVKLIKRSLEARHKRSINETDLATLQVLQSVSALTGCSIQQRPTNCSAVPNIDTFRSANSICNNRQNTRWGSSNTPFARWLPAEYQDGTSLPRGWSPQQPINNQILPLVRAVSNRIVNAININNDPQYSHLVTIFGQFTDHDLTFTPTSPIITTYGGPTNCDQTCSNIEPCFPIRIPSMDPRFGINSQQCIPFVRSAATCGSGQTFGTTTARQQLNSLTSFIDAGQVYGSDEGTARSLRDLTSNRGLLRVNTQFNDNGRELLPFVNSSTNFCANRRFISCDRAGDGRSNENIALTSLHTLMLREHNRLARALAQLNPTWDGERLYQEARKIMGAYLQVITFRDYLPQILGPELVSRQLSNYPGYDQNVDPSIANVFATAAFRFGHTMVQPFIFRLNEQYNDHPNFPGPFLHLTFFASWRVVFEGGVDPLLRGLAGRPAKLNTQSSIMNDELRERLFKFSATLASDLASLNMQRGRDHGIPGYNKWRRFCGLSQPQNLAELTVVMNNADLARNLLELYGTPDNIDVWVGGVAEPLVPGGKVGPLFGCMIATQFQKIRQGDRFWWENNGVFTAKQRQSLSRTSFARIFCDNTGITEVPRNPFLYRPRGAGYTPCVSIPAFDLSPWKEDGK
uniref:Eosinophil peroxidase n=1 Tax=Anabas testudineus TaxID=64144 RepID=A0A7N5ZVG9_ANATE